MCVLVTGGAGFIGCHLVRGLLAAGHSVRILDDFSSGSWQNIQDLLGECEVREGSILDSFEVERAVEGVAAVFHLAAMVSVPQSFAEPERCFALNRDATVQLAEAARMAGAHSFVFASTCAVYGHAATLPNSEDDLPDPMSPYAASKLQAEQWLAAKASHSFRVAIPRFFNVYGPRQAADSPYSGVISRFMRQLSMGEAVTIFGDGQQTRDFAFVSDVVEALLRLSACNAAYRIFNVGTGTATSLLDLYANVLAITEKQEKPKFGEPRVGDVRHSQASTYRIRTELSWEPQVSLAEGLSRTWQWLTMN